MTTAPMIPDPIPMTDAPLANTPVFDTDRFPRWFRRGANLPSYIWDIDFPHSSRLYDHPGQTILDGRLAFVSEPYSRGCVDVLSLATDLAIAADCELRVSLPTWHGYGTIRFAWLASRDERIPKKLAAYVLELSAAADTIRQLASKLPPPAECSFEMLRSEFWRLLWLETRGTNHAAGSIRHAAASFLAWHGYASKRARSVRPVPTAGDDIEITDQ